MSAPDRHYHNLDHLDAMVRHARTLGFYRTPSWDALFAAILFHDIVYDARRNDNEERSADCARTWLAETGIDVESVVRAVLATRLHKPDSHDRLSVDLTDLDMAVLSSDDYRAGYAAPIRREYAHVPLDLYVTGRVAFLRTCLDESIYFHPVPSLFTDEMAHANIADEVARLLDDPAVYLREVAR